MVTPRILIWRAVGHSTLMTRLARRLAPSLFAYLQGKPLDAWLLNYRLGRHSLALSNDPHVVETVLQDRSGLFPKSASLQALLRPLIGDGLFGQPGGAAIKLTRRPYTRALAQVSDIALAALTRSVAMRYIQRWRSEFTGSALPLCTELSRMTIDIVAQATMGRTFSPAESERFTALFFDYHRRAIPLLLLADNRPDAAARIVGHMELDAIGSEMRSLIRQRFVDPLLSGEIDAADAPFFAELLAAKLLPQGDAASARDAASSAERALDEIAVMLLAGHETTASVLSWLLWELARRPADQARAACDPASSIRYAAVPGSETPTTTNDWLKALTKEALRLYPPIPVFLRDTRADASFRGKRIPKGSFFAIAPWTLHRHRKHWSQPDAFQPERWLSAGPPCPRSVFIPFGIGPRTCPGANFAEIEMREILRVVLQNARFDPATTEEPQPMGSLTSRPDREIWLRVSWRGPEPQR